jgi:hypothetical protein
MGDDMAYQPLWTSKRQAILDVAERIKAQHPAAWAEVKVPGQPSRTFISLVVAECQKTISAEIGCNLKRGGPDVSLDVLALPNPTGARDASGKFAGLELIDIIAGAEGGPSHPEPSIIWLDQTQKTIDARVPGGWVNGQTVEPTHSSSAAYPGDAAFDEIGTLLFADYAEAGRLPDSQVGRWIGRTTFDYLAGMTMSDSIKKHRAEWRSALGL